MPDTVRRAGLAGEMEAEFDRLGELYQRMIDAGVPAEDARFLIPNAANTNFKIVVNFLELLHICDLRLCTRAQWEFRRVASLMRAEVHRKFPELASHIQPKCGDKRWGYCDESLEDWQACPIGKKRPHKKQLFDLFDAHRRGELAPLEDEDFRTIESIGSSVATAGGAKPSRTGGRRSRARSRPDARRRMSGPGYWRSEVGGQRRRPRSNAQPRASSFAPGRATMSA